MTDEPEEKKIDLSAEVVDREERRAAKEQAKREAAEKKAALKKPGKKTKGPQDELDAALARGRLADRKRAQKKQNFRLGIAAAIATPIVLFLWWMWTPYQAPLTYGICKTYLELNVQFPQGLRVSTVQDMGPSIRIWYTQTDASGAYRMENIQCFFKKDETRGTIMEKITMNRREVAHEKVEDFNRVIRILVENPPNLDYPPPLPDSLEDLQIDTDSFRKRIF